MSIVELNSFEQLKKEIADTYRKSYPSCQAPMEEWKGQDIVNFQEELIVKVKGRLSEKWFYSHIKTKGSKLPRIDMLNMLSQYAGYQDWRDFTSISQDFTIINQDIEQPPQLNYINPVNETESTPEKPEPRSERKIIWTVLIGIILLFLIVFFSKEDTRTYKCCFAGLNGSPLIQEAKIEVYLLQEQESPIRYTCDNFGCCELKSKSNKIRLIVTSPYYKTDTITRVVKEKFKEEQINLRTDDYALMIHYFSKSKLKDWKQRKIQLDDMISEDVKVFQVYNDGSGMELYNKKEFIDKLTMPLKSLKNIQIIEMSYSGNKISLLRFIQSEQSK